MSGAAFSIVPVKVGEPIERFDAIELATARARALSWGSWRGWLLAVVDRHGAPMGYWAHPSADARRLAWDDAKRRRAEQAAFLGDSDGDA